jgi:hypothetical protein
MNWARFAAQLMLYVPLMAVIGYFSTSPPYRIMNTDQALIRVSFSHAAQRMQECRQRSDEELAKRSPNMRLREDCPRERAPTHFQLEVDGTVVVDRVIAPSGLKKDGAATLYARLPVSAGKHTIVARLNDKPGDGFSHSAETTADLEVKPALIADFSAVTSCTGWM